MERQPQQIKVRNQGRVNTTLQGVFTVVESSNHERQNAQKMASHETP